MSEKPQGSMRFNHDPKIPVHGNPDPLKDLKIDTTNHPVVSPILLGSSFFGF